MTTLCCASALRSSVLVEQRVQLDLVDHRRDEGQVDDRRQMFLGEVGDSDRTGMSFSAGLDHAAEGVHILTHRRGRPVNQVEVDVIQAQSLQAGATGSLRLDETVVFGGQLGGDEQLRAGNPGGRDRAADAGFVAVDRGGVNEPAADFQRRRYRAFGLVVRQIGDAQAKHRHGVFVIESYGWYGGARLASQRHSPTCEIESSWIRTKPGPVIERGYRRHFIGVEFEIEHVEVARNP